LTLLPTDSESKDVSEMFLINWDLYTNGIDHIIGGYKLSSDLWKRLFKTIRLSINAVAVLGQKELVESGMRMLFNRAYPSFIEFKPNTELSHIANVLGERELLAFETISILSTNLIGSNDVPWVNLFDCVTLYEFSIRSFPKNGILPGFDIDQAKACLETCSAMVPKLVDYDDQGCIRNFCSGFKEACRHLLGKGNLVVFHRQNLVRQSFSMSSSLLTFLCHIERR
jgi:hypothetical protein